LTRSSGKVRTGIGAAREDVNVSIEGGTRVEIKGVAHIRWIPELTHNEAFRQKSLLEIRRELKRRIDRPEEWRITHQKIDPAVLHLSGSSWPGGIGAKYALTAVNLPGFREILSFFTQPGKTFADEISDRLKVIACLEKPNMLHTETIPPVFDLENLRFLRKTLKAREEDAQLVFWASEEDRKTALETIEERCRLASERVPNETRKAVADGTTVFERVLPGPDRMYPDTDSAPIPIPQEQIARISQSLPVDVHLHRTQLNKWRIPADACSHILKSNLFPLLERIVNDFHQNPRHVGTLLGHFLKNLEGRTPRHPDFTCDRIHSLFRFLQEQNLETEIVKQMLPILYRHPNMDFQSILLTIHFTKIGKKEIRSQIPVLKEKFKEINRSKKPDAGTHWVMGKLKQLALGNMPLKQLESWIERGDSHD